MAQVKQGLRRNDLVEVRTPDEILRTLDSAGTVDQLPFMPEMLEYCGKRFRVARKVVKICTSGTKTGSTLRGFRKDDIVLLDGLRCSGAAHDGCQKLCTIFWREAWLRKVSATSPATSSDPSEVARVRLHLKTMTSSGLYFCQASELAKTAPALSRWDRYTKWVDEVRYGNCSAWEMAERMSIFVFWKIRRKLFGPYARGSDRTTPAETLNLRTGELVQVKPMEGIAKTLDQSASNRGLWFSPNMRLLCGQERRVERRIDKLIVDGTGEMRKLKNTVFLEGSHCGCAHIAFGGCSRGEFVYWREIWLQRCHDDSNGLPTCPASDS